MLQHAADNPDEEICGLLGGKDGNFVQVYPVKNIDDDKSHRFLLDPGEQIAALRTMRDKGETLLGIYHSHPFTKAVPSETDHELAAYPETYYFIISPASRPPVIHMYYYDGSTFIDMDI